MPYDNPQTEFIKFETCDFGAGTGTANSFKGPAGKKGILRDIGVMTITETFACTTTAAKVRLGTAGDADAYAELAIADGTAATDTFRATQNDTDAIIDPFLPADTQIELTQTQSVDETTAAGIGIPFVVVDWV